MKAYNPKIIEKKWQSYWEKNKLFEVKEDESKKKFYGLIEFPYPSGAGLHVGHPRPFTAMDVICRKKRMEGCNVLFPIGFDAFGLPTENYAIKTGRPPAEVTAENIKNFTRQLKMLGYSFDWSRCVDTTDPKYYKWTQWIFLQLFKHGLAYKKAMPINWCLACKIGLANEEVIDNKCERCGGPVEKRNKEQWMLAITKYADKLLEGLKHVDYIPQAKIQQENWIGRSEGAMVRFRVIPSEPSKGDEESLDEESLLEVFTTRPDTLFGATYMVVAPEHPLVKNYELRIKNYGEVRDYIEKAEKKSEIERTELQKEKTGVELRGIKAINPVNNEEIPVFVADYVLIGYGTGAIMAVPAHDQRDYDFAKKYDLFIREVVSLEKNGLIQNSNIKTQKYNSKLETVIKTFEGEGINVNSGFLNGLETKDAKEKIILWLEEKGMGKRQVQYKLRDWVFSRQRYWGEPIPLVYCEKCDGWVPLPESELPLELPKVKKYEPTDTGESPLAAMEKWVKTKCPKCGGPARRETDTMPNWAGSSWYFLRYCDPRNNKEFAGMDKLKYWLPIDWYNGGMEHTVLHLLYSRFWNQFLYDIGAVPISEPYQKRTSHGMILAPDGEKMSKSRGNVINPDEMVEKFGADAFRVYIMFMGPFDQAVAWDTNGLIGVRRFIEKVWLLQDKVVLSKSSNFKFQILNFKTISNDQISTFVPSSGRGKSKIETLLHQTIKKVSEDIEAMRFNTAISQLMILANEMSKEENISLISYLLLLQLLSPFAPHLCEELWSVFVKATSDKSVEKISSISQSVWPEYDPELIKNETITIAVQVNGKLRDTFATPADISEEEAKNIALALDNVKKWLGGKTPRKVIYVKGKLVSVVV